MQYLYFRKKVAKFTHIGWKCHIFEITKFELWPKPADNRPICGRGIPLSPKVLPKFFLAQTDKNWRFYLKKYFAWRIFDLFAIMTIKKQWIFIRENYFVFWPWPKLFSFSHHIFVTNRAMTFMLSVSKHIYSSYPKHIQMILGYLYFLPNNMLNFKNVFIENFHH